MTRGFECEAQRRLTNWSTQRFRVAHSQTSCVNKSWKHATKTRQRALNNCIKKIARHDYNAPVHTKVSQLHSLIHCARNLFQNWTNILFGKLQPCELFFNIFFCPRLHNTTLKFELARWKWFQLLKNQAEPNLIWEKNESLSCSCWRLAASNRSTTVQLRSGISLFSSMERIREKIMWVCLEQRNNLFSPNQIAIFHIISPKIIR